MRENGEGVDVGPENSIMGRQNANLPCSAGGWSPASAMGMSTPEQGGDAAILEC